MHLIEVQEETTKAAAASASRRSTLENKLVLQSPPTADQLILSSGADDRRKVDCSVVEKDGKTNRMELPDPFDRSGPSSDRPGLLIDRHSMGTMGMCFSPGRFQAGQINSIARHGVGWK